LTDEREGVVQFQAAHTEAELEPRRYAEVACKLVAWREILALTRLVGRHPRLYDGAGYGNVSARTGAPSAPRGARPFLVTGTQTSGLARIGLDHFAAVSRYDLGRNRVESQGLVVPSSESMTHGAIYDLSPHIRFVFHAHTPVIWRARVALGLPETRPDVGYGTPEMAREVGRLFAATALSEVRVLAMGGHEDGVITFGRTAEEAGQTMLTWLARAYEGMCLRT
jgi:ribulose-5-phosphate 4-epimerase/fuculose-1-phosphate aldolase